MRRLRSLVLLAALGGASPVALAAQQARAVRDAEVRAAPEGNVIATVETGTTWRTARARNGYTLVTLEGWVDASRLGGRRDSFPASIDGAGTLRLRAEPSTGARILGVFSSGAGVRVAERRGSWARVRRDGWVLTSAIAAGGAAPGAATKAPSTAPAPARAAVPAPSRAEPARAAAPPAAEAPAAEPPVHDGALRALRGAPLALAPGARAIGTVDSGAVIDPVARDRGWVRVRVEAWVPESLLVPADSSFAARLTAADLRLDPDGHRGRTVRWTVQFISLQKGDALRRGLQVDEPYLLARGPEGENAILYLAVPPALLETAQRLTPLSVLTITARVRNGRSQPTGAPVLELLTMSRR